MLRALNKYLQHVNIYIEAHGSKFVLVMVELQTIIVLELFTQKPGLTWLLVIPEVMSNIAL